MRNNFLKTLLTWLPSLVIMLIYIPNALSKIFEEEQVGKIVSNRGIMIATGIFLIISSILFLYNRTILIGTTLLALYMTFITCIHIYKGKPHEVALLIVIATIFCAFLRKPKLFHQRY
ncbi:hypothetical protein [Aureivirga marina]|uniref:hypothetical protein n=1 Tax=Aureivirga marina TaxID=1182451 RepID=UPI0018C9E7A6|nr:hypothetical protein [Aureivirga marina]